MPLTAAPETGRSCLSLFAIYLFLRSLQRLHMDSVLSAPPRAHIPVTSYGAESSAEPSPFTSPTSSRPPSPPLPLRHLSDSSNFTSAPSSAAQSRSSSKDPLFKQRQQRDDHRSLWHRIKSIVGGERALSGQDAGECIRGRRPSLAAAEAGQRPLKVSASVAEQTGRRWPMSRERAQVSFSPVYAVVSARSADSFALESPTFLSDRISLPRAKRPRSDCARVPAHHSRWN